MLLIITNSKDATVDYLSNCLHKANIPIARFDTDFAAQSAELHYSRSAALLRLGAVTLVPEQISNVWYRRPERLVLPGFDDSPESKMVVNEWTEALEGFFGLIAKPKWMNHPAHETGASHKIEQLTRAKEIGFELPDTLVTMNPAALKDFYAAHDGRIITKPMGKGYVERKTALDSLIYTNRVEAKHLEHSADLCGCPTLFQQEIDKAADVRITFVDGEIHAVKLLAADNDGKQRCDIRRDHMQDVAYSLITLPSDVEALVRKLVASYQLRFSAIDMAITEAGQWVFFEINPNGQWAWLDQEGATDIASSFVRAFSQPLSANQD